MSSYSFALILYSPSGKKWIFSLLWLFLCNKWLENCALSDRRKKRPNQSSQKISNSYFQVSTFYTHINFKNGSSKCVNCCNISWHCFQKASFIRIKRSIWHGISQILEFCVAIVATRDVFKVHEANSKKISQK